MTMEQLGLREPLPFEVGALYNRQGQIHDLYGGQRRGGISTPTGVPYIFLFTGASGANHGYADHWEEEGRDGLVFYYYGEGQTGDMKFKGGNAAIRDHVRNGKRVLLFKALGKGLSYRYEGELFLLGCDDQQVCEDSHRNLRKAIVFRFTVISELNFYSNILPVESGAKVAESMSFEKTVSTQLVAVRSKQSLFRRRLLGIEKQCRLTGIKDLRFLMASHIKPWSQCETGTERVDGYNGLLLAPHADHLFDKGWITFEGDGRLVVSERLPTDVRKLIGLDLKSGRRCGAFDSSQQNYLAYHRDHLFEKKVSVDFGEIEEALEVVKDISSAYKKPL
jgi:5-methylcytosine-specific restriction protein A